MNRTYNIVKRLYTYNCDYCGLPCSSSRSDARFCKGSGCRTANLRRERRRNSVSIKMEIQWPKEILNAFMKLEPLGLNNDLKDMALNHGLDVTAKTVQLMAKVFETVTTEKDMVTEKANQHINHLNQHSETLKAIQKLIYNIPYRHLNEVPQESN